MKIRYAQPGMMPVMTEVPMNEVVSNILGSSGTIYDWWTGFEYDDQYDWDYLPVDADLEFITASIEDPSIEGATITTRLSVRALALAFLECDDLGYRVDWDNMDAPSADVVLQKAVLGEVVYG